MRDYNLEKRKFVIGYRPALSDTFVYASDYE